MFNVEEKPAFFFISSSKIRLEMKDVVLVKTKVLKATIELEFDVFVDIDKERKNSIDTDALKRTVEIMYNELLRTSIDVYGLSDASGRTLVKFLEDTLWNIEDIMQKYNLVMTQAAATLLLSNELRKYYESLREKGYRVKQIVADSPSFILEKNNGEIYVTPSVKLSSDKHVTL